MGRGRSPRLTSVPATGGRANAGERSEPEDRDDARAARSAAPRPSSVPREGGSVPSSADVSTTISGMVERVVFRGQDGFAVARLGVLTGARGTVTVAGRLPELHEGESVQVEGDWI